ncbi:hypothetical protein DTM15_19990 [Escherichia coli]|nr:hypothetical protein DTM15_19990 [Escherichia coli]
MVVVNEHDNHDRQRLDSSLVYTGAHNVYYVKSCLSDAKCFSGSRYSFRVQELKPLLFHNWPVHGEIAWLFPCPMLRAQCLSHRHCIRKHQRVLLLI